MSSIRYSLGFSLLGTLAACSSESSAPSSSPTKAATAAATQKAAREYRVHYNTPISLDSTDYYYQPISVVAKDGSSPSRSFSSGGSYGESTEGPPGIEGTCYNVLFLRKSGPQEQLLFSHSRFVITSIDDEQKPDTRWPYLFYTVVTADTNADGVQDTDNATGLFVSDRSGHQVRQLTPPNAAVQGWQIVPKTSLLLVAVRPDSNHDREFTRDDETYWLRFDLRDLTAPPLRQPAPAVRQQLQQQMLGRQSKPTS